ncbi:MAG: leucyl/phenylalanyl-tRNA--protein transferase [Rhodothermales bacterium]|nr:leucyl/phenylalanyl-tRNA--protein transferase [Rhodothermales bacterium]
MGRLPPSLLLDAYSQGLFPMADEESSEIYWFSPDPRAIIPLDGLKISRSLRAVLSGNKFETTFDRAFEAVIEACSDRTSTWISDEISAAYIKLHKLGYAHSVECWHDGNLAGGLYGVSIGGAFFGESMFHRVSNASKVALVALVEYLNDHDFQMLDIQFLTPHLETLGAIEIPRPRYLKMLKSAVYNESKW